MSYSIGIIKQSSILRANGGEGPNSQRKILFVIHRESFTGFVTRLTRRMPLVEQELLTLPEHLSSLPVFSGVRVTRSLVYVL